MKLKSTSILAGILTLAMISVPLAAQACGDKDQSNSDSNLPEGTETSFTVGENSYSS